MNTRLRAHHTIDLLAGAIVAVSALDAWTTKIILQAHVGQETNGVAVDVIGHLGVTGTCALRFVIGVAFAGVVWLLAVWARSGVQRVLVFAFAAAVVIYWGHVVAVNFSYYPA